jgi:hypothetical protein
MLTSRSVALVAFAAMALALATIAAWSPTPDRVTDRDVYEATAGQTIVPDCSDLHCFRVLVPWVLGSLPGGSLTRWRAYAALCDFGAACAVFQLCLTLGFRDRSALLAAAMSAFGFGSLYTLHDAYTSDPLMFLAGPLITNELLRGRVGVAAALGAVGVFAKEFAAAPLYIFAGVAAIERRWLLAARAFAGGNFALIVWLLLTLTLMLRFNYSWGATDSANLAGGAVVVPWLQKQSTRGVLAAMFNEFGALYVLAPLGFLFAPRSLRVLAIVSLPFAAIFGYLQQPDRALWNFHFLVVPLAALVLDRAPVMLAWATVGLFGIGNLRVGAQFPIAPVGRLALGGSVALALVASAVALRGSSGGVAEVGTMRSATSA